MGSAKQQSAISNVTNGILREWDKGSKSVRKRMLQDFIAQNQNKTGPELEQEFAQAASLFLTRLTAWLRLTYMLNNSCLNEQLRSTAIFLSASSGHKFLAEFLEVGGILTVLEIINLKQAKEADKAEALRLLQIVANAGRKYKELMCESYGIRAVAECLAKSKSEETQECARTLLETLARGNPKYENQAYKALIVLLLCNSPKAQQMAAQTLRVVQPIVGAANPSIVEPLLTLFKTLHLEVQYEAIELVKLLMSYEVQSELLKNLVTLLRPAKEDMIKKPEILEDPDVPKMNAPLPVFVQQAAVAKCIGILARESTDLAEKLIQLRVVHNLMYAMGNLDYADSQRQASISLEFLSTNYPIVDDHVKDAMGDVLYEMFITNPETLYVNMNPIQADVLRSNKVNIPGLIDVTE
ncbi:armadillo-like helical domain containing protein 1 isoform X2 [Lineus longissimus]|uniref:armadillo-like helical domain containing protein 1 isoform X2 n=1 Tax=Lineus longissimus TaxID=88925 RepID=UPI002B4D07FA